MDGRISRKQIQNEITDFFRNELDGLEENPPRRVIIE